MLSPFTRTDNPKKHGGIHTSTPATAPFTNAELESAVKVLWVGNPPVPGQSCKVGEHNKEQKNDFEDAEGIEMDTPLEQRRVQQGGECDAGNRDTTCLPPVLRGWVVSVEDVTPERERVPSTRAAQKL